jgi:hypothetical protein
MTTPEALRAVYAALGGTAADVADLVTTPEILDKLAALLAAGEIAVLPTVAAADNGKVLTVVDGAWAAAALPT